jgi:hypothetical protein
MSHARTHPPPIPQTTAINAGTFITVMFMSGRLPSASEIRTTPIRGNGIAASIRDQSRANIRPTPPRPLRRPAPISNGAWQVFLSKRTEADFQAWRDQRDWTERKYALWDTGKRLEPPSYGPGKPCSRFMKCPCGEVFDMHGPEEVLVHVPHINAAGAKGKCCFRAVRSLPT